jgi:hypothetical protein
MRPIAEPEGVQPVGSCPNCGAELSLVCRVRFVESAGHTSLFPPGTIQDTADCESCDERFQREDGGPWRQLSFDDEFEASEDTYAVLEIEQFIDMIEATFPGRFGGSWIDSSTCPARVCIGLVDGTAAERDRILEFFAGPPDRLVFVPTRYSAHQLDAYQAAVSEVVQGFPDPKSTTISIGRDYSENRVTVTMNAPDPKLEALIQSVAPAGVLVMTVDPTHHFRQTG